MSRAYTDSPMQFLLWLRVSKLNKAGTAPVYLRIFLNTHTRSEYATGLRCRPDEWNAAKGRLRGNDEAARDSNSVLKRLLAKAQLTASRLQDAANDNPNLPRVAPADVAEALRPKPTPATPLLTTLLYAVLPQHSPRAATRLSASSGLSWLAKWPEAKRLRLVDLTVSKATDFVTWLAQQPPRAASKRTYLASISSLLATAAPTHPPVFLKLSRLLGAVSEPVRKALPTDWQQRLQALDLPPMQTLARDAFLLAYYLHGCRIGKVLELQWSHIDWQQQRIRFTTHKRPVNKDIALLPPLIAILERYRGRCPVFVLPLLPADYLQLDEVSQHYRLVRLEQNLGDALHYVRQKLGWPKLNPHLARHTFALKSYKKNGNDLRVPQQLLGHKDIATTAKYIASLDTTELDASAANTYD